MILIRAREWDVAIELGAHPISSKYTKRLSILPKGLGYMQHLALFAVPSCRPNRELELKGQGLG